MAKNKIPESLRAIQDLKFFVIEEIVHDKGRREYKLIDDFDSEDMAEEFAMKRSKRKKTLHTVTCPSFRVITQFEAFCIEMKNKGIEESSVEFNQEMKLRIMNHTLII